MHVKVTMVPYLKQLQNPRSGNHTTESRESDRTHKNHEVDVRDVRSLVVSFVTATKKTLVLLAPPDMFLSIVIQRPEDGGLNDAVAGTHGDNILHEKKTQDTKNGWVLHQRLPIHVHTLARLDVFMARYSGLRGDERRLQRPDRGHHRAHDRRRQGTKGVHRNKRNARRERI